MEEGRGEGLSKGKKGITIHMIHTYLKVTQPKSFNIRLVGWLKLLVSSFILTFPTNYYQELKRELS